MNSDSASLQNYLLTWLLAEPSHTEKDTTVECEDTNGAENSLQKPTTFTSESGHQESGWKPLDFQFGEIPTVQERFQAVLKRRLQTEIEDNPPLFPWESQITDYPEYTDEPLLTLVPTWGWTAQQSKLELPILLPENIFRQLLEKCQALITSSMPVGVKLVQAVESFFPEQPLILNNLAGMVLMSASRSGETEKMPILDGNYSDLQPQQQMMVSLLAAKQLLESLALPVSQTNPLEERQWLTSVGVLHLKVEYQSQGQLTKLLVQADLPTQGFIKLQGKDSEIRAESSSLGCLSVELSGVELNQTYTLTVELKEIDQQPLSFVIIPTK